MEPYLLPKFQKRYFENERLLILGAGGWFGECLYHMLSKSIPVLRISKDKRDGFEIWDWELVRSFKPTIIANFAFITRHKVDLYDRTNYIKLNSDLIERMERASKLENVKILLTASSGASLDSRAQNGLNSVEIYGALKKIEEQIALSLGSKKTSAVVLRAYSVSGPFVRDVEKYAFSSFIHQAISKGSIRITSSRPVFRRYVSTGDLIALGLIRAMDGWSGVIESGGELVEIGELASLIGDFLGATIEEREIDTSLSIDNYFSDNSSWQSNLNKTPLIPLNLVQQIETTSRYLINMYKN